MTMIKTVRLAALCLPLALPLSLPLASQAQEARPAAPAQAATPAQPNRPPRMTQEQMMQNVEAHLTRLHTLLGITAAQEPQWQEFAKVTRDNAVAMRQRFSQRGTRLAQMNAADNMMDYAQITDQLAQERMRVATTFRTLYDTMSAEQKARADIVFRERPGGHHPHRPRHG